LQEATTTPSFLHASVNKWYVNSALQQSALQGGQIYAVFNKGFTQALCGNSVEVVLSGLEHPPPAGEGEDDATALHKRLALRVGRAMGVCWKGTATKLVDQSVVCLNKTWQKLNAISYYRAENDDGGGLGADLTGECLSAEHVPNHQREVYLCVPDE